MARRLGAIDAWLAALRCESPDADVDASASLEGLPASWLSALRYAELVNESGHAATDDVYRDLARYWDEGEIVEITLVAGLFAYFNRFNDALHVEVTR